MKAFLHIGTPKTATTTIQSYLYENRDSLLDQGYIVSTSAGKENNLYLALAAYDLEHRDELTRLNGVYSNKQLLDLQARIIDRLKTEIAACRVSNPQANKAIYSSEYMHLVLRTPAELTQLRELLKAIGFTTFEVIIYLRDPVELAGSYYSTSVKAGITHKCPQPPDHSRYNQLCDHQKTLELYEEIFGKENITARVFEKGSLREDSIVSDFSYLLGISDHHALHVPEAKNESLSSKGVMVQRALNKIFPRWIGDELNPLVPMVIRKVSLKYPGKGDFLSVSLRQQYEQFFTQSNEFVRKNYFPERSSLFEAVELPVQSEKLIQIDCESLASKMACELLVEICGQSLSNLWEQSRQIPAPYDEQEYESARQSFEGLINVSVGVGYFNLGQFKEAIAMFELAEDSAEHRLEALLHKAMCISGLGDAKTSDEMFLKLLKLYPDSYRLRRLYALNSDQQELSGEAEIRWSDVLNLMPNDPVALLRLGICLFKRGGYEQALSNFDRVLESNRNHEVAIHFRERCLAELS